MGEGEAGSQGVLVTEQERYGRTVDRGPRQGREQEQQLDAAEPGARARAPACRQPLAQVAVAVQLAIELGREGLEVARQGLHF